MLFWFFLKNRESKVNVIVFKKFDIFKTYYEILTFCVYFER